MTLAALMLAVWSGLGMAAPSAQQPVVAEGLAKIAVEGTTDLPGNFYLSFVFSRNLIMLDGKGNIIHNHSGYTDGAEDELYELLLKL